MAVHSVVDAEPEFIWEGNSARSLGLACVPLVGFFVSRIYDAPLEVYAEKETDPNRLIQIIHLKNNYKIARIISLVFSVALLFFAGFDPVSTSLFGWIGVTIYSREIAENKKIVAELQTSGYRTGIVSEIC